MKRKQIVVSRSNGVVPYPPTLKAAGTTNSSVTLAWDPHPTGGSPVINYIIQYRSIK